MVNPYIQTLEEDEWKLNIASEMIDIKSGKLMVETVSYKELEEICEFICSS